MSPRTASWLAWALCALTVALVAYTVVFAFSTSGGTGGNQGLTFLFAVVWCAVVGAVVASRRPRNPIGWLFAVSAASFATAEATFRYAVYGLVIEPGSLPAAGAMAWPQTWMWVPGVLLVLVFLPLYFPNGRLLSPRWRVALWLGIAFSAAAACFSAFLPGLVSDVPGVNNPLGVEALRPVEAVIDVVMQWLFSLVIFLSVVSLILRFWRSRGEERQQMKWLTYAAATMFAMILLTNSLDEDTALFLVVDSLTALTFAGIPAAVGVAVVRHRLYDIDRIINRTLVYGVLTVSLALVYLGSVVSLQTFFRALTGGTSQLVIVASTLAIAALFSPLRRGIQAFVDGLFYRRKYDAAKILEAFSAKLRDETELDRLGGELIQAVRGTVQPAHVRLWLRPPARPDWRKGEAGREKIPGGGTRNAFRNGGETVGL